MAAVGGWRLGFGDCGSLLMFPEPLLFCVGVRDGCLTDIIKLLAPGRLILGICVFQVIAYCSNERAIAAIALNVRGD